MENTTGDVSIRPVRNDDMRMIFEWRNTPSLVKLGSSEKKVTWEEHCRWFAKVLEDKKIVLFIINFSLKPVGQIRFEKDAGDTYVVTIYLIEQYTGKGIGVVSLKMGVKLMLREDSKRRFISFIKNNNKNSISAFSKACFKEQINHGKVIPGHVTMSFEPGTDN